MAGTKATRAVNNKGATIVRAIFFSSFCVLGCSRRRRPTDGPGQRRRRFPRPLLDETVEQVLQSATYPNSSLGGQTFDHGDQRHRASDGVVPGRTFVARSPLP
jgi:hypothetical protein